MDFLFLDGLAVFNRGHARAALRQLAISLVVKGRGTSCGLRGAGYVAEGMAQRAWRRGLGAKGMGQPRTRRKTRK